jgi:hypothetical protein
MVHVASLPALGGRTLLPSVAAAELEKISRSLLRAPVDPGTNWITEYSHRT